MDAMDQRLDRAPCGYLSLTDDFTIIALNETLLGWLGHSGENLGGQPAAAVLSMPGRILLQMYFLPMIRLSGRVEEMYLSLRTKSGDELPVILYAARREEGDAPVNECMLLPMRRRQEYEHTIREAEKEAARAQAELDELHRELEDKRREVQETRAELARLRQQSAAAAKEAERAGAELERLTGFVEAHQRALIRNAIRSNLSETDALLDKKNRRDD